MLHALWVPESGRLALIVHHLAVDAVSWRILWRTSTSPGRSISGQPITLPTGGRRSPAGAICSRALAHRAVTALADWRQVTAAAAVLPAVAPERDTYASAGQLSLSLDAELTRQVIGEVPAAFHAGVQDILLIAFGLAFQEFLGTGAVPIGIDVEGHGRDEELARDVDLSRTVGWFTAKYPVALHLGRSPGSRSLPGRPRWAR